MPIPLYKHTAGAEEREEAMQIKQNLFPGGVRRALTMSYDDGPDFDYRLVELFNQYGIRGTFHLNSGRLGKKDSVKREDVAKLYRHHEVSCHTVTHPFLDQIPDGTVLREILRDRRTLEGLCGYPVRGMSYPFGRYTEHAIALLRSCGMEYSRTVEATGSFDLPEDFMKWHPTAHHNGDLEGLWKQFIERDWSQMLLFYIWGHSFEFDRDGNWERMEEFCRMAGGRKDVWYATNIEIMDYVTAVRALRYSEDQTMVYNPSALDVWISVNGDPVCIEGGSFVKLAP